MYTILMVAFGHTAVGAAVGLSSYTLFASDEPLIGLSKTVIFGIASHYIADLIPHGHFFRHSEFKHKVWKVIFYDLILSILLFFVVALSQFGLYSIIFWHILFGIAASQLPDVLDGLIYIGILPKTGIFKIENNFHQSTHWHGKLDQALQWNLKRDIWQIMVSLISLLLIIIY